MNVYVVIEPKDRGSQQGKNEATIGALLIWPMVNLNWLFRKFSLGVKKTYHQSDIH